MTNTTHWVDKYLAPLSACIKALSKAREYPNPQAAWDGWDNGSDLLWVLRATNGNLEKRVLCACDIAECVLPIFEQASPKDRRPREALEAARRHMFHPTVENKQNLNDAIDFTVPHVWEIAGLILGVEVAHAAISAARAAINAAHAAYGVGSPGYCSSTVRNVADDVDNACRLAALAVGQATRAVSNVARLAHAAEIEHKAQADIVRKYFPNAPIPTEYEVTHA